MTDYTPQILSFLSNKPQRADLRPLINVCILAATSTDIASEKEALLLQIAQMAEEKLIKLESPLLYAIVHDKQAPIFVSITSKGKRRHYKSRFHNAPKNNSLVFLFWRRWSNW